MTTGTTSWMISTWICWSSSIIRPCSSLPACCSRYAPKGKQPISFHTFPTFALAESFMPFLTQPYPGWGRVSQIWVPLWLHRLDKAHATLISHMLVLHLSKWAIQSQHAECKEGAQRPISSAVWWRKTWKKIFFLLAISAFLFFFASFPTRNLESLLTKAYQMMCVGVKWGGPTEMWEMCRRMLLKPLRLGLRVKRKRCKLTWKI